MLLNCALTMRSGALRSRDGLGSAPSISDSAAACGLGRSEVDGSPGERVALEAAMRAANWHAPFLRRQLSHFWSFARHVDKYFLSFAGAPLRFIGAKRPSLREGYLPAAQLPTQGTSEMRRGALHSEDHAPVTLRTHRSYET